MTYSTTTLRRTLIAAASFSVITTAANATSISGQVTDTSGVAAIEGAIVTIAELDRNTSTDRFGEYSFTNLPEGEYTVTVSYIGADDVSQTVTISSNGADLNFVLGDNVAFIDNVLVVGSSAAQAGALNQQRASDSIISVIDSDGLGNFPDTTVADSLARVPGISIENDQGEGRYVSIRGINTDLVAAAINGVRTPSPEDRRGVLLDGVPSDLLDSIEVQKSLTPDVDADSLGGVINLKTISAFSRKDQFIRAKVEGRYNEITDTTSPKATLTYSNVFNDNLGVALSANYQSLDIDAHNNEAGGWGQDETTGHYFLNDDYEQRWYELNRERIGFVANFDWRVNEGTDLYLRTLYNRYEDDEIRNKFEYKDLDDGAPIDATTSVVPINEVDAEVRQRAELRQIQTYALGGQTRMDLWTFDYEVAYAYAEEDDSDNHDVTFRFEDIQDVVADNLTISTVTPETPQLSGSAVLGEIFNPSNYNLDEFEQEFTVNEDTEVSAKFDVSRDSLLFGMPVVWKAGVKYRDREKVRDVQKVFTEGDVNLAGFVGGDFIGNWRLPNPMPAWPDAGLTANLFQSLDVNQEASDFDSLAEDFKIDEAILAGYAMGTFDIGPARIVAGVRVENTQLDATGNTFFEGALPSEAIVNTISNDYTNVLPSVNVKYSIMDNLIGRFAYYGAVVRPAFGELAPTAALNDDQDEATLGNPDLEPYEADNFDLSIEYYPTNLSVISVGVFYKQIDNAIYEASFDLADVPASVNLSSLTPTQLSTVEEVTTFINVDSTDLYGIEFNYVQQLDFLPVLPDGFLISGNLTLTDSEATLPDGRDVPFLKQSDTIWNIALGYDQGPWDLRISANYRGDYLDVVEEADLDRYTDDRLLVEASAKFDVNDTLQLYIEGKNLTDEDEYYYFGDESRLSQYDEFGRSFILGARLTF
ncbi:MAG: TonB-dependent receptor [Pseudomonadota bacterium]